jgi:hypothetical protein
MKAKNRWVRNASAMRKYWKVVKACQRYEDSPIHRARYLYSVMSHAQRQYVLRTFG